MTRSYRILLRPVASTVVATGALAAAAASAHAQSAPPITIHVAQGQIAAIGAFPVSRDPRLSTAIRRWGRTSSRKPQYQGTSCAVRWNRLKIRATFANLGGGGSACQPRFGRLASLTVRSPRFETARGLRVGSPSSDIAEQYPDAEYENGVWVLASFVSPIGDGETPTPTLKAHTRGGSVYALSMWVGGAGD